MGFVMHTWEIRALTADHVSGDDLVQYLLGNRLTKPTVYGAVRLDEEGDPYPPIPVKGGVKWDGFPQSRRSNVAYSITTPDEGRPVDGKEIKQQATVYERRDGVTSVVGRVENAVSVTEYEPLPARVYLSDKDTWYGSFGVWTPIDGLWVVTARIESV